LNELIEDLKIPLDRPVDLVVLAVKTAAIRCKVVPTGEPITFRKARNEVEGEILTVKPSKVWRYQRTHYMTGEIVSKRIDIPALQLKPLALKDTWPWKPEDEYWGEPDDPLNRYFEPVINFGARISYEMEQIIPFQDPENFDSDPILEASEYHNCGDYKEAYKIIQKTLIADLRCLDAHTHLGAWEFNSTDEPYEYVIDKAKRHYEVGIKIAELSLDKEFNGVLPWGRINNRPFLRCLHGYGLCLWRLGDPVESRKIFNRMLWLNPTDNQGVRFLLADIDAGKTWYERGSD